MADTNAVGGLKWVKDEIVTSLRRVRGWVEQLVERGGEESHLNDAVTTLGDVRGVLSALQLIGPARLTEEMQTLCEDLAAGYVSRPAEAAEALMLALIQLPDHLDKLEAGQTDVPLVLLPSINDLRGSRSAAPLSEAELLVPTSVLAESEMPASQVQQSLGRIAGKIRPYFHLYLLQWIREDTSRQGLVGLGRLFHRLQRHIGKGIFHELFLVAEAVADALLEGNIAADPRTKVLLAHLDRVVKPFATDPRAWPESAAQALLFDLLSLIARCKTSSYRVNELHTVYGLESEGLDDAETPASLAASPGPEALGKLVVETRKELAWDVEEVGPESEEPDFEVVVAQPPTAPDARIAPEFLDIFLEEAREEAQTIGEQFARWRQDEEDEIALTTMRRSLHTLKGSGRLVGAQRVGEFSRAVEMLLNRVIDRTLPVAADVMSFMDEAVDVLPELIAAEAQERPMDVAELIARAESLALSSPPETAELQLRRAQPKVAKVIPWPVPAPSKIPEREVTPEAETAALTSDERELQAEDGDEEAAEIAALVVADEELLEIFSGEAAPVEEAFAPEISEEVVPEEEILAAEIPEEAIPWEEAPTIPVPELPPSEQVVPATGLTGDDDPAIAARSIASLTQDRELTTLFLEDASDIVDRLDRSLRDLQLAPTQSAPLEEMQRSLHTLKGSARLSGFAPIGDLSHAFESLLTAITHGEVRVNDDNLELAQRALDTLSDQIDAVAQCADMRRADDLVQALALALEEGLAGASEAAPAEAVMAPCPPTAGSTIAGSPPSFIAQAGPATSGISAPAEAAAPQIRIPSDLLNRLVNNAGEISIYRSQLAQQGGLMHFRLGELDRTVDRLREQWRQLEMETEAQIPHRYERDLDSVAPGQERFDPLELDRFSTLQQLARSLAETVDDLVSLRTLLRDLQGESDTLLQQQAQIADDLQVGLLRTRIVPFVQAVPRLHRVVRQTAQQMGKVARLEVFGPKVELDRSIQERILAPLEHLLRNAVAHGIESPQRRASEGKPAVGVVSLVLNREGNDLVVTVADDGAGLDLEAIRRRALERGLIAESAEVGEEEITQLILESGFTTADEVSQIAGRGVGLDVVNAEVKQMSGTFALETQSGHGTSFTIRLPLTLAIIDALLVQLGDEIFAIPDATVEAVSRISRAELEACYRGQGGGFTYADQDYRVMYLRSMLQLSGVPDLGEHRWLPVLLARSGDQRIAFHVDQLLGAQRIVVKPLGPEFSSIRWLSGGTILPDGRVAMILDLLALIRSAAVQDYRPPLQTQARDHKRRPCILVVDDSLTVRRGTSRMLQRQDMDVITATDGVDALTRLETRVPDVVLLDIDMPRMDGYELTRHIRRSERLKKVPLIMITSRTGEKHRRHALKLGVDRYLGKPYQETDLLDEISSLLLEASL